MPRLTLSRRSFIVAVGLALGVSVSAGIVGCKRSRHGLPAKEEPEFKKQILNQP